MAGPAGGGLGPLALLLGQVGDGLGEAEQHPAAEAAPLGPGAAGGAAGLPGPGNQAARQQQRQPTDQEQAVSQTLGASAHFQFDKGRFSFPPTPQSHDQLQVFLADFRLLQLCGVSASISISRWP